MMMVMVIEATTHHSNWDTHMLKTLQGLVILLRVTARRMASTPLNAQSPLPHCLSDLIIILSPFNSVPATLTFLLLLEHPRDNPASRPLD